MWADTTAPLLSGPGPPGWQGCWRVTGGAGCAVSAWMLGAQTPTGLRVSKAWNLKSCGVRSFLLSCSHLQEAIRKLSLGILGEPADTQTYSRAPLIVMSLQKDLHTCSSCSV